MSTESPKKIAIIGAGFSGLTLAWALTKKNIQVEVFESSDHAGGLISSEQGPVLTESAANGILANAYVEELFADLDIEVVSSGYKSKKRWIFRDTPQQLPVDIFEIFQAAKKFIAAQIVGTFTPFEYETVAQWGERCFSKNFVKYLISPGLQGVYGTRAENLSAAVILKPLLKSKVKIPKGKLRGSVAPLSGMQEITRKLELYLKKQNMQIHYSSKANIEDLKEQFSAVVVATSHLRAADLLQISAPETAELIEAVPTVGLASVTLAFKQRKSLKGFGCLFPEDQNFNALGVLFNTDIFPNRGDLESETWIFSEPFESKEECINSALSDRKKLLGSDEAPHFAKATIWANALPLYGFELKKFLDSGYFESGQKIKESSYPVYLTGNYLGSIGLGKILFQNIQLAQSISKETP